MNAQSENARVDGAESVAAAPFWRRVLADLVDSVLMVLIGTLVWHTGLLTPTALPELRFDWIDYTAEVLAVHHTQFYPFLCFTFILTLGAVSLQRGTFGATVGDRIMGLELVDYQGGQPAFWQGVVHSLGTTLGLLILLQGYAWAAVDRDRQSLSNYLSRTLLVVR